MMVVKPFVSNLHSTNLGCHVPAVDARTTTPMQACEQEHTFIYPIDWLNPLEFMTDPLSRCVGCPEELSNPSEYPRTSTDRYVSHNQSETRKMILEADFLVITPTMAE